MDDLVQFLRTRLLVQFLRARLDEDEQVARQATGGWWNAIVGETADRVVPADAQTMGEGAAGKQRFAAAFDAEHIARHDPVRVLREIEAWRAVLDFIETPEGSYYLSSLINPLARVWEDHEDFNPVWLRQ